MTIGDTELNRGDIFIFEQYDIADPVFLEDCELIVVKVPSIKNDKYTVDE
jgi:hypothetical protein